MHLHGPSYALHIVVLIKLSRGTFFITSACFAESSDNMNKCSSGRLFCSYLQRLHQIIWPVQLNYLVNCLLVGLETQDGTHQTQCEQEPILCLARRRLETVWQSWCTGGRFESQSSQFSFSNGNMLSSLHIPLRERRETEKEMERDTQGQNY